MSGHIITSKNSKIQKNIKKNSILHRLLENSLTVLIFLLWGIQAYYYIPYMIKVNADHQKLGYKTSSPVANCQSSFDCYGNKYERQYESMEKTLLIPLGLLIWPGLLYNFLQGKINKKYNKK